MTDTLVNRTRYVAGYSVARNVRAAWEVSVVLKAAYTWDRGRGLVPTAAAPLRTMDEYAGDPATTGLLRAAELGPPKPRIDVVLAGAIVFASPIEALDVAITIGTRLKKMVRVHGDRRWRPGIASIVPSRATLTAKVPICWERAFGGMPTESARQLEADNPTGRGIAASSQELDGQLLPNFEDPRQPLLTWKDRPPARAFGPIAPHWHARRRFAGTYDERWEKTRRPLLPTDFDPRFLNVAPADQQLDEYVPGEDVRIINMTPDGRDRFALPELSVPITVATETDLIEEIATVDTIEIEPEPRRLTLLARAAAPLDASPAALRRIVVGELTPGWRRALEEGKQYLDLGGARA